MLQKFFSSKVIAPSHLCFSVVMAVMITEVLDVLCDEPTRTHQVSLRSSVYLYWFPVYVLDYLLIRLVGFRMLLRKVHYDVV